MLLAQILTGLAMLRAAPETDAGASAGSKPSTVTIDTAEPAKRCQRTWHATIVEAGTAEALPGARVVYRNNDGAPISVVSDAAGLARVEGLCPGELRVSVTETDHAVVVRRFDLVEAVTRVRIDVPALHEHHSSRVIVVHDENSGAPAASDSITGERLRRVRGRPLA
ncbi:MAG: hypothetical protein IAG13_12445 [Deltaproteobacteria bacterium]|nr:hypothetical protein [Nannocystaceae bacterium]